MIAKLYLKKIFSYNIFFISVQKYKNNTQYQKINLKDILQPLLFSCIFHFHSSLKSYLD